MAASKMLPTTSKLLSKKELIDASTILPKVKTVTEAEHMKNKNGGIDFRNKYTFVKNLHISIVFVTIFILEIMPIFGNIILAAQCWNFDFLK